MELYEVVDLEKLERSDYFHYFMNVGTTIEFTVKLDVSKAIKKCKKESVGFHPYILFQIYEVINNIKNFRYDILDGKLIEWKKVIPTFSSFNTQTKLFYTLCEEPEGDYIQYNDQYNKIVSEYKNSRTIVPQETLPQNIFNISCIPWLHFEHFSSNTEINKEKIIKMITIGKYEEINSKMMMPVTMQVSHSIVDGYHISMFFEELQNKLNA